MAKSVNLVVLAGVLGRDAETKFIPSGRPVTKFAMATNYSYKKNDEWVDETDWHNIVMWGNEKLAENLVKGSKVTVAGRLKTRSWEDKNGEKRYVTEIIAEDVVLQGASSGSSQATASSKPSSFFSPSISDDDVPF